MLYQPHRWWGSTPTPGLGAICRFCTWPFLHACICPRWCTSGPVLVSIPDIYHAVMQQGSDSEPEPALAAANGGPCAVCFMHALEYLRAKLSVGDSTKPPISVQPPSRSPGLSCASFTRLFLHLHSLPGQPTKTPVFQCRGLCCNAHCGGISPPYTSL